jgi:hypothetical protein
MSGCDKIQYDSERDAHNDLVGLRQRNRKHKFSLYRCGHCGKLHITTVTKHSLHTPKRIGKYPKKFDYKIQEQAQHKSKKKKK